MENKIASVPTVQEHSSSFVPSNFNQNVNYNADVVDDVDADDADDTADVNDGDN
jgi:hypothetical protein